MRRFDGAPGFHTAQALQHLGRLKLTDGAPADPRECVLLKPDAGALGMACAHFGLMHGRQPLTGDMLEGARAGQARIGQGLCLPHLGAVGLVGFARRAWVATGRDQLAGFVSLVAGIP